MRRETEGVRAFYDTFGWSRTDRGSFGDTEQFVDSRAVLGDYNRRVGRRVARSLKPRGTYFLDAGSGARPHTWHSSGFRRHVCVDLSIVGLREARSALGERGLFVIADLARLPFRDDVFDATLCAHVLYHVHRDEQESAVRELHRTLAADGRCVIVYRRVNSLLERIAGAFSARRSSAAATTSPSSVSHPRVRQGPTPGRSMQPRCGGGHGDRSPPSFYIHAHDADWFRRVLPAEWRVEVRCCRTMGPAFTRAFVPESLVGRAVVRLMVGLEDVFPRIMTRIGMYPMLALEKRPGLDRSSLVRAPA